MWNVWIAEFRVALTDEVYHEMWSFRSYIVNSLYVEKIYQGDNPRVPEESLRDKLMFFDSEEGLMS